MDGFFNIPKTEIQTKPLTCVSCGVYKNAKSPKMRPFGKFEKKILNIGESPGETEDERGKQWQGKTGRLLQKTYRELEVDLFEDCLNYNAINCRPSDAEDNNRKPSSYEIACCRQFVYGCINENKPKVIILLGGSAIESVIGSRWKKDLGGISKWRGFHIPDRDLNAWVCPVFHPSFIERQSDRDEVKTVWKQDLESALSMAYVDLLKPTNEYELVEIVEKEEDIIQVLKKLNRESFYLVTDTENTGLKPDANGHKIACISFCNSPKKSYCIRTPSSKHGLKWLKALLENPKIYKISHNMKYEAEWFNVILDITVSPWYFDTMQAAHILDNRPGINSLKFQTYIHFGIPDYDSEIENYLKSTDKNNGNSFNRVMECMDNYTLRNKLMTYCALDSLFTYRIAMRQAKELDI